ncbi:MAG: sigma-70 family RNA polymerase sigma factor, partial [Actinobacteria bacterium]|nr:sigma-70 family RNA polymerase sigma factor [Actinomycetota bacterium]
MSAARTPEWELVEAAQEGNREAFGQLYGRYVSEVSHFLGNRVRDRGLVEDLTSETFTRALRRIDSVSDQGRDPGAWFTTIARNLVLDHSKSSRYKLDTPTAQIDDRDSHDRGPEQTIIDRDTAAQLRRHVERLSADQRQSIQHRFFDDLSVAETAAAMGRSEGAVKALQHRAINHLRTSLTENTGPPAASSPRAPTDPMARARQAVASAQQRRTVQDRQAVAPDRAQQLARWHTDDQAAGLAERRGRDRD